MKIIDATKPWQRAFFECKDLEPEKGKRIIIELPKHGVKLKESKDAAAHRRKSNRTK